MHAPCSAGSPQRRPCGQDELEPIGSRAAEPQQERDVHPYLSSIISPEPPDEAAERRGKSVYYGLCSEVDAQLGRLFERLKEIGEWDKTLVVFTADHVRHPHVTLLCRRLLVVRAECVAGVG